MSLSSSAGKDGREIPTALYLHGFASSPNGQKASTIRGLLSGVVQLIIPDLNVPSFEKLDFEAMVAHAAAEAELHHPRAIVGSSLGALIALELALRGFRVPLVLIAPALGVMDQWIDYVKEGDPVMVFNYATEEETPIHRAFFEQMREVRSDAGPPSVQTTIVMGRNDESVPFSRVREIWDGWLASGTMVDGSRFIDIVGGDHGLHEQAPSIAEEIRRAVEVDG